MRGHRTGDSWRDFAPLAAVAIIGLALAVSAFVAVRSHYQTVERQQFRRNATYYSTSFKDEVARHVTSLAAIRAFVSSSRDVTRWEFSNYAHQILPQNNGFKAVLWVPHVSGPDRQAYEAALQKDGLYGLRIRELTGEGGIIAAAGRDAYLPISYVEPFDGNDSLVGLDLSGDARFAELFRTAEQTGRVAASAPLAHKLIAGTRGPVVLLAVPLTPNTTADPDAAPSQAPARGYALGVLQLQTLVEYALGPSGAPVQAAIAYSQDQHAPTRILLPGARSDIAAERWFGDAAFHQMAPIEIAGRRFQLALRSVGRIDPVTNLYVPAGASLLVIALTALLIQNMSATILRKQFVERAVVARTAQLRAANESLHGEVQQRRQAEIELRVARDRAESANRAKSSFMASMSHELRTPLNAIIGFSQLLAQARDRRDSPQADYANEILGSGKRLLDLINDILDLTQMDSSLAHDGDSLVYMPDCIAAAVGQAQPLAMTRGVLLKASIPDHLPSLHGDNKRLTKALTHLVLNAVKFTPEGGAAVITAHQDGDGTLVLDVTDTGVGMPPGAKEKIREAFSQYDGRLGRKYEGVGLGLTYVGRVAELHQASFEIVSEAGKGTRVRLVFPHARIVRNLEVA